MTYAPGTFDFQIEATELIANCPVRLAELGTGVALRAERRAVTDCCACGVC